MKKVRDLFYKQLIENAREKSSSVSKQDREEIKTEDNLKPSNAESLKVLRKQDGFEEVEEESRDRNPDSVSTTSNFRDRFELKS